ncbi:PD40 domain-containing protein [bacterium]|nr:PD40 domain-containing protein [bacterium]
MAATRFWTRRLIIGGMLAAAAAPLALPGCAFLNTGLEIQTVTLDNPSLNVGTTTRLTIEATTLPGRSLRYQVVAERGRVSPQGFTDQKNFVYYAPFTSRSPDAAGNLAGGDTLRILVEDGFTSKPRNETINLGGSTVAYVTNGDTNGAGTIMLASTDDNGMTVLHQRALKDSSGREIRGAQPTVSPDGRYIAYVDYAPNMPSTAIRVIDAGGRVLTVVNAGESTGFNFDPSWSPSSRELLFSSDRKGNFDIYRVSTTGENNTPIAVTASKVDERFPAWNPSLNPDRVSTMVASVLSNSDYPTDNAGTTAAWNLYLYNIASGRPLRKLTNLTNLDDYAFEAQWRADGQAIAYTRFGPMTVGASSTKRQRVFLRDVTMQAGSDIPLNPMEFTDAVIESSPTWSLSGNQVAYLRAFGSPKSSSVVQATVWRQSVNGLQPSSEAARQWTEFNSPIPSLRINESDLTYGPFSASTFSWH